MQRQVLLPDSSIELHATVFFLLIADSGAQTAHSTRVDGTWILSFHRFSHKVTTAVDCGNAGSKPTNSSFFLLMLGWSLVLLTLVSQRPERAGSRFCQPWSHRDQNECTQTVLTKRPKEATNYRKKSRCHKYVMPRVRDAASKRCREYAMPLKHKHSSFPISFFIHYDMIWKYWTLLNNSWRRCIYIHIYILLHVHLSISA